MERKIGEVFDYRDNTYTIIEDKEMLGCNGCALSIFKRCGEIGGCCCPSMREDKKFVISIEYGHE